MAKLPQKPVNIVHDYFPAGADGSSPHTQDTPALFTDIESYEGDTALPEREKVTTVNEITPSKVDMEDVKNINYGPEVLNDKTLLNKNGIRSKKWKNIQPQKRNEPELFGK